MKNAAFMSFDVDKDNKKVIVKREFAAQKDLVWKAWTTAEILDQWWAPKPWKAETKSMDFTPGGMWIYAMVGPEGEKHWSRADYKTIEAQNRFITTDGFCDENGNMNPEMPTMDWDIRFEANEDSTLVHIDIDFDRLEDLEKIIEMGFKEGFTMGLGNLDEVLERL